MISKAQIESMRGRQADLAETQALKAELAALRQTRNPLFLTFEDLEKILAWKLGRQIGRQREKRLENTDELIRKVTGLALSLRHKDPEYELELRVQILCALRGVGMGVASAVLALVFPNQYAVIDFRGWRQLFDEEKTIFSTSDYARYMGRLRPLAAELGWPVQEVDHAIWEFDRLLDSHGTEP